MVMMDRFMASWRAILFARCTIGQSVDVVVAISRYTDRFLSEHRFERSGKQDRKHDCKSEQRIPHAAPIPDRGTSSNLLALAR